MTQNSINLAQCLVLIFAGILGLWQFKKGWSVWNRQKQPNPRLLFPLSWLFEQQDIPENDPASRSRKSTIKQTEAVLNMIVGFGLMLLPGLALFLFVLKLN